MKTLVIKDMKVAGIFLNLILVFFGLFLITFVTLAEDDFSRFCTYIAIVLFMVAIMYRAITYNDKKAKIQIILNSLPIDRGTIVKSRYITVMIYILYSSLIAFISSYRFESILFPNPVYPINFFEICNIIGVIILIYSIFLPLDFYIEGKDKNNRVFLLMIVSLVTISVIAYRTKNILYRIISSIDIDRFPYELMIISLIVYLVSLYLSIKIYETREL